MRSYGRQDNDIVRSGEESFFSFGLAAAGGFETILLPKPRLEIGRPLMAVLKDRKSVRTFLPRPLPDQIFQVASGGIWD